VSCFYTAGQKCPAVFCSKLYDTIQTNKMSKKLTTILSVTALIVATATLFITWQNKTPRIGIVEIPELSTREIDYTSTTTPVVESAEDDVVTENALLEEDWLLYENTKYGYRFSYPSSGNLQKTVEMEPGVLNESVDVNLSIPGYGALLQVSAELYYTFQDTDENMDTILVTLKSFAENVYESQVKSVNPNFSGNRTGSLTKTVFAEEEAYNFTLNDYFAYPSAQYGITGTHTYVITEHNGTKFIIHYPAGDTVAQEVVNSFEFVQ